MITVVDYGVGNIGAILNMLDYIGIDAQSSSDPAVLRQAGPLILPGVGAFDKAMTALRLLRLIEPLTHAVKQRGVPVLGICLGMQLLAHRSEEGQESGLGWINAEVRRIRLMPGSPLKIPHIGWAEIQPTRASFLFNPDELTERYYFDHSYYMVPANVGDISAVINYESPLCCAVESGNILGTQFHPEKSHRFGIRLLATFGRTT